MQSLIKTLFVLCVVLSSECFSTCDENAERDFERSYFDLATGEFESIPSGEYPWPVRVLSIGHTTASYQNYGGAPYFHHGIDIRADAGSDVVASAGGKVVNIENYVLGNPLYWEVAILDDNGFLWQYHHVDRLTIPQNVVSAFQSGLKIAVGTKLGAVVYWSTVALGERFHHIHLNILGKNKEYLTPFSFLFPLNDSAAPEIVEIALTQGGKKVQGNSVSGTYSLMAQVKDRILSDRFDVPPHQLSIEVDAGASHSVWKFDRLPGGSSKTRFIHDFYHPILSCGNYDCRRSVVDLGFGVDGNYSFPLSTGMHEITLRVKDYAGNEVGKKYFWTVRNGPFLNLSGSIIPSF